MSILLSFVIEGKPRTKKNSGRIFTNGRRPRILPSAAFAEWNAIAQPQLAKVRSESKVPLPIACDVNVRALFIRDRKVGDAVNYYEALADALEEGGILVNDVQIKQWDGTRLLADKMNPRVIVTIEECR